ncbi:MAG: HAMP domain-containing sensor histidine kinase [Phycisphaeraceae bacterium]
MTLARRMSIATAALVLSLLVISGAAIVGVTGLSADLDTALAEYEKLRSVYEIGPALARARAFLEAGESGDARILRELEDTVVRLTLLQQERGDDVPALAALKSIVYRIEHSTSVFPPTVEEQIAAINGVVGHLARQGSRINQTIQAAQTHAQGRQHFVLALIISVASIVTFAAAAIIVWQYRSVMLPLRRLRQGVRTVASGKFGERVDESGDREFVELARDFNEMATELEGLYRDLETKVAIKSKELVLSERLASVGFLAAGVAHEINNPLGIMSGYAELSLRKLKNKAADAPEQAQKALQIVCDEAIRCKKIIEKLLSLVRSGPGSDEQRHPVSLARISHDVAEVVQGLPRYRDRKIDLRVLESEQVDEGAVVLGNETELRQVLLNLVINGLEAVDSHRGRVTIETRRNGPRVTLSVTDNGKGMNQYTLDHIFEPFFTQKRGAPGEGQERGTGLGLSITHAIVEQHGGRIHAVSEGLNKGSRFTVELPAA